MAFFQMAKSLLARVPRGGRSGQAMVEYVIVAVALLAVVVGLAFFLYAMRLQADRTLTLVSSDYP